VKAVTMTPEERQQRRDSIPDQIQIVSGWHTKFVVWYGIHYALGMLAVLLATLVAAQPHLLVRGMTPEVQTDMWKFVAFLSAAATGLLTFLTPETRGDRFREAWSLLSAEITRFLVDPTHTVDHVLKARENGEAILHPRGPTQG
jgi:hypothetical protein